MKTAKIDKYKHYVVCISPMFIEKDHITEYTSGKREGEINIDKYIEIYLKRL